MAKYTVQGRPDGGFELTAKYSPRGVNPRQVRTVAFDKPQLKQSMKDLQEWVQFQRPRNASESAALQSLTGGQE